MPPKTKARPRRHESGPASSGASTATVTERQATPRVEGRLAKRRDGGWSLLVDCPFCGVTHTHGAPSSPETRETARVSHCDRATPRAYRITVGGPAA
jgi:hypothetical protein